MVTLSPSPIAKSRVFPGALGEEDQSGTRRHVQGGRQHLRTSSLSTKSGDFSRPDRRPHIPEMHTTNGRTTVESQARDVAEEGGSC
jgi:hypothetical protein